MAQRSATPVFLGSPRADRLPPRPRGSDDFLGAVCLTHSDRDVLLHRDLSCSHAPSELLVGASPPLLSLLHASYSTLDSTPSRRRLQVADVSDRARQGCQLVLLALGEGSPDDGVDVEQRRCGGQGLGVRRGLSGGERRGRLARGGWMEESRGHGRLGDRRGTE
eukprot:371627-Hanusia_phi.AAC.1